LLGGTILSKAIVVGHDSAALVSEVTTTSLQGFYSAHKLFIFLFSEGAATRRFFEMLAPEQSTNSTVLCDIFARQDKAR
jgi:hypothetical protein